MDLGLLSSHTPDRILSTRPGALKGRRRSGYEGHNQNNYNKNNLYKYIT